MRKTLSVIALVLGIGWLAVGRPMNDLAGLFWPERPAPWETVDAFQTGATFRSIAAPTKSTA
jgi:hypothetical protein